MPWDPIAEGALLGKYRVLRRMGGGGMAVVYEAEHVRLGQRVAIKVLREERGRDPVLVQRFEREGRAVARLKSRNIVRILDVDSTPSGAPYLVMELLEGTDLSEELARRGPLPVAEAVEYALQACRALGEAHARGIVHRDVKPSNLFLANEASTRVLKVLDFGIARDVPDADVRLTDTEVVVGTALYMSPEQLRGARDVDARSDVWSLGVTLFELLAGHPPFSGTATTLGVSILTAPTPLIGRTRKEVPAPLAAIVARALEKDREHRYPTASAMGVALAELSSEVVIAPRSSAASTPGAMDVGTAPTQASTPFPAVTPPRTRRVRYRHLGLVAAAVAAGAGAAAVARHSRPAPAPAQTQSPPPVAILPAAPPEDAARPPVDLPQVPPRAAPTPSVHATPVPTPVSSARLAKPAARASSSAPSSNAPPLFYPTP